MRPEGLCQLQISMTLSGIEPANFRLVARCLNQLCCTVPTPDCKSYRIEEGGLGVHLSGTQVKKYAYVFWWGNRKDRDRDTGVDGSIILK